MPAGARPGRWGEVEVVDGQVDVVGEIGVGRLSHHLADLMVAVLVSPGEHRGQTERVRRIIVISSLVNTASWWLVRSIVAWWSLVTAACPGRPSRVR